MIELKRVRLINWHNFQDETIPFRMVTYLIGVNAVGKTTIMDAIRYCLTTNKDFNAAGNRKSGRTLQGSIHGKQRGENVFLRPGHTVGYVGVEFYDHEKKTTFVIAVRVESESPEQELRHVAQDWFITKPGVCLEDLLFIDKNRRPTKKDAFKASCPGMRVPQNQKDARKHICRILGIGDSESPIGKKFNEVFHMGTSLKEIYKIRSFINTYILPEPEIRVEVLQSDMRELEHLEEILQEAHVRSASLGEIVDRIREAQGLQSQVTLNIGLITLARLKKFQMLEEQYQRTAEQTNLELERLEPELKALKDRREQAQAALQDALQNYNDDPMSQASKFYEDQEKELGRQYREQVHRQNEWDNSLQKLSELLKQLADGDFDHPIAFDPEQFLSWTETHQHDVLDSLPSELSSVGSTIEDERFQSRKELEEVRKESGAYDRELRLLRDGILSLPTEAVHLRDQINSEFEKRGMQQDAKILCELLYMEDDSWQMCAEAVLGSRRFDIIVSPAHYLAAKGVFTAMGEHVKDVSLVDTPNLERDSQKWHPPSSNMLASKVGTENFYARQYTNHLMYGLVCCDSADELEQYPRSVTRDLLRHQSYRLQRMRKPRLFIGETARKRRLDFLETELLKMQTQKNQLEKRTKYLADLAMIHQKFIYERHVQSLKNNLDARKQVEKLNEQLNGIRKKLRELETNPLLQGLFDRIQSCREVCQHIDSQIDGKNREMWTQEQIAKQTQEHLNTVFEELDAAQNKQEEFSLLHPELSEEIETRYVEASRDRTPEEIERNRTNYLSQREKILDEFITTTLQPLQREYNMRYTVDYPLGLNGQGAYIDAYKSLVHIELERSLENLRKAQIRCKERFRKEILFRMKDDIYNAKAHFQELNRIMAELTYGEERYHFAISEPQDKELQAFYQIIIDKNNVQITENDSLFTREAMSQPAYEAQVDELMAKIMADVNQAAQDRSEGKKAPETQISKYVDYRTYLDYDIIVENVVSNISVPLSQVSGDSSGGENQAPFYVAICASLLQIYNRSSNCIRLVLLDEAFNNMTSDRIEPMMRMFRETKMQLVLISTVEKCSAIYPYCDIVYSIVKTGSRASLAPFEKLYGEN